ncbi:MAG: hypothetical protein EPN91_03560 [Salinibacterium sp.]|nr:MAG: hypothetical protein EPN91_03560 [Salinibacterium sp.]
MSERKVTVMVRRVEYTGTVSSWGKGHEREYEVVGTVTADDGDTVTEVTTDRDIARAMVDAAKDEEAEEAAAYCYEP